MIMRASISRTKSTSKPVKGMMVTLPGFWSDSWIMATRSSMENKTDLVGLRWS